MNGENFPTGRSILVVEDNEVNLKMIHDMLSIHDHKVAIARNGQEAIEQAKQHKPELILMDVRMPVMDGIEATRRLRAMPEFANTPIIATSASTGKDRMEQYLAEGCTDHIAKPFQTHELFEIIKKYLNDKN